MNTHTHLQIVDISTNLLYLFFMIIVVQTDYFMVLQKKWNEISLRYTNSTGTH